MKLHVACTARRARCRRHLCPLRRVHKSTALPRPSMTYSCASSNTRTTPQRGNGEVRPHLAQARSPGRQATARHRVRWGAWCACGAHSGVQAVGVTISREQYEFARQRGSMPAAATASRSGWRTTATSTMFPTTRSAIGMFEQRRRASTRDVYGPGMRLLAAWAILNHAITRPTGAPLWIRTDRQPLRVPDGALLELGQIIRPCMPRALRCAMPRRCASLRPHVRLVANSKRTGTKRSRMRIARARIWRLYMAGSASPCQQHIQVQQVPRGPDGGKSAMPCGRLVDLARHDVVQHSVVETGMAQSGLGHRQRRHGSGIASGTAIAATSSLIRPRCERLIERGRRSPRTFRHRECGRTGQVDSADADAGWRDSPSPHSSTRRSTSMS